MMGYNSSRNIKHIQIAGMKVKSIEEKKLSEAFVQKPETEEESGTV